MVTGPHDAPTLAGERLDADPEAAQPGGAELVDQRGGVSLLDRADRALGFLLAKRFDAWLGLVTSGFSADWGDVSPVHADQQAIYLDHRTNGAKMRCHALDYVEFRFIGGIKTDFRGGHHLR